MSWKTGGKFYRRTDFKMTLWYLFTFLISALVICTFLYLGLRHQLLKEIDQFLLDETREMEKVLSEGQETDFLMRFEDEAMARKYYPFFFQILDRKGKTVFTSEEFQKLGYVLNDRELANIQQGKEFREEIHLPGRKREFRIISTPVYQDGKLTRIIQLGTHLHFVRKNLSQFKNNILAALPVILVLGGLGGWALARRSLSPIGYIALKARDISSEKLSERLDTKGSHDELDDLIQTINEMIARLEGSFKRMAEFTADVSHELKTPICAMRGEAEVLLLKERKSEEYQEGFAHFIEQFDHLNHLINDLILLSKVDTGEAELKITPVRLDLLIRDLCNFFHVLAEQKNIDFRVGAIEEVMVQGDQARLQQLFTNLIDNAIKYTLKGSIHVTLENQGGMVLVKFKDTGIGIPDEDREKIFKRFYRVEKSRSRETGGVGLGLSIAGCIATAHHGRIAVESQLNLGSTFTVFLPVRSE